MPANRSSVYPIFPSLRAKCELPCLLFVQTPFIFIYYSGLFVCRASDDTRRIITLAISELAMLAGMQFLLYAAEEGAPDYHV